MSRSIRFQWNWQSTWPIAISSAILLLGTVPIGVAQSTPTVAPQNTSTAIALPDSQHDYQPLAMTVSRLVTELIPREIAKDDHWGQTKRITSGFYADGNPLRMKWHRRKKEVRHGTWKRYQVVLGESGPGETTDELQFEVSNLRSAGLGTINFDVDASTPLILHGKMRSFNRGVHLLTITAQGDARIQIRLACECAMSLNQSLSRPGVAVVPRVNEAHLTIHDFNLHHIGEIQGRPARELGKGLRFLIRQTLSGPALRDRINLALQKQQHRLVLSPADLLP